MKKNELFSQKTRLSFSSLTRRVLWLGYLLIAPSLFYLIYKITQSGEFTFVTAAYFGEMLEHVVAALTLLTAGAYLVERVARDVHKDK